MTREISSYVRKAYEFALSDIKIGNVLIPVFDEFANDDPAIIKRGSQSIQAYIVLQSQFEDNNAIQNMCSERYNAFISIRIVTIFPNGGGKLLSEQISDLVLKAIFPSRGNTSIVSDDIIIQDVKFEGSNTTQEFANNQSAYSKIIQINTIVNI